MIVLSVKVKKKNCKIKTHVNIVNNWNLRISCNHYTWKLQMRIVYEYTEKWSKGREYQTKKIYILTRLNRQCFIHCSQFLFCIIASRFDWGYYEYICKFQFY